MPGKLLVGALAAWIASRLRTIHPNPGPARYRTPEAKAARKERRKARRGEKWEERRAAGEERKAREKTKDEMTVVTWNVQGMSMGMRSKRKARAVAEVARKQGWDMVLLMELRAERCEVVWMGEEERVVIVHSEKAGIMMRGEVIKQSQRYEE